MEELGDRSMELASSGKSGRTALVGEGGDGRVDFRDQS